MTTATANYDLALTGGTLLDPGQGIHAGGILPFGRAGWPP